MVAGATVTHPILCFLMLGVLQNQNCL